MKSCCDEYCANHGCNQGRNCPARKAKHSDLPITMDDDFMNFDWSMRLLRDFCAAVGLIAIVAITAFFFWYKS